MKKITLSLLALVLGSSQANAQSDFNKWSVDLGFGLVKPGKPMTPGYFSETFFTIPHFEGGVRYMLNNKFGLKLDYGYDFMTGGFDVEKPKNSTSASNEWDTRYQRISFQGVMNLGRIMSFEDWTRCLNLQFHSGIGVSNSDFMNSGETFDDVHGHIVAGLTGMVKLGKRVALTADFTTLSTVRQNFTFDGNSKLHGVDQSISHQFRTIDAIAYNASLGLTYYIGGNSEHADWAISNDYNDLISSLENRIVDVENKLIDSDSDGVADYLDLEPNTPAGNMVDVKGRSIDLNKNGVADVYENYFKNNLPTEVNQVVPSNGYSAKQLINDGFVSVYFDFDVSKPRTIDPIGIIVNYLNSRPESSVTVNGFADVIGSDSYNQRLSNKRASNVAKLIQEAGISSSRIIVNAKGEDKNIPMRSRMARRVTFSVN